MIAAAVLSTAALFSQYHPTRRPVAGYDRESEKKVQDV